MDFPFCDINDVISINRFGDYLDCIYPIELDIKGHHIYSSAYASYLDLHLEIDYGGRLRTKLSDKREYFNISIEKFSFICKIICVYWFPTHIVLRFCFLRLVYTMLPVSLD